MCVVCAQCVHIAMNKIIKKFNIKCDAFGVLCIYNVLCPRVVNEIYWYAAGENG